MLRGTLDTFSTGELLWLAGRSQATGTLRVRGESSGVVWCRGGFVTWASTDESVDLVDVVARAGIVPAGLDRTAAADQLDAELRGGPTAQRIHDIVRTATEEAVFEMASWAEGEIAFDVHAPHRFGEAFCYPVVSVLDSVRRRRARWAELVQRIGGIDCIVAQAPAGPGDGDVTMSRAQWRLLASIDGRRDVAALARHVGLGLLATAELVVGLLDAGLVEVVQVLVMPQSGAHPARGGGEPSRPRHLTAVPAVEAAADEGQLLTATAAREVAPASAHALGLPDADFVEAGDQPSRDLILRLLSAVKEL